MERTRLAHVPQFLILLLACLACPTPATATAPKIVPLAEPDWPQFRGPRRDGICRETGLLASWPEAGPRIVWSAENLGRGYSSPTVVGARIYITGDVEEELRIFALDRKGRKVWTAKSGESWRGPYPGARSICTFSDGRLYLVNAHGRAACLDAATGREEWALNVLEAYEGSVPTWGISECLLVDGEKVIVTPGGRKASMVALDKRSGSAVWAAPPILRRVGSDPESRDAGEAKAETDKATYASPQLIELGDHRLLLSSTSHHVIGVDADSGQLHFQLPIPTRFRVIALTPVISRQGFFMTAPDSPGGKLYRLTDAGGEVRAEEVWTSTLDTCHGGVLAIGDFLFGSWYRRYNGWGAIDARTGETLYRTKELAMGSALHADERFYCLSQEGVMALVEADRKGLRIVSRFQLAEARRKDAWVHPVIVDGHLYLRYHERLECRDIQAR